MCLNIKSTKRPTEDVTLFKYYRLTDTDNESQAKYLTNLFRLNAQLQSDDGLLVTSPLWDRRQILRKGERLVSDRKKVELSPFEKETETVDNGIHAFTNKKRAIRTLARHWQQDYVVIRATGKPEHFIATGEKGHVAYSEVVIEEVIAVRFKNQNKTIIKEKQTN